MIGRSLIAQLPNLITLGRLAAVPVTVILILNDEYGFALALFVAAGASDAVDGFIAKQFDAASELGAYLDPLADKALLVGVYVTLAHVGHIPAWLVVLVVTRDLLIVGGFLVFHILGRSQRVSPLFVSKLNTVAQIVLAGVALADQALELAASDLSRALSFFVGFTTVASGLAYLIRLAKQASAVNRST